MNGNVEYNAETYLEESLEYYEKKSISCKRWYYVLTVFDIIISSLISFTALFIDILLSAKYIVALMGSVVTILSAFKATFGFHKNWIEYRTAAEQLKFHKALYKTESAPYNTENRAELLIVNVNLITDKENRSWRSTELNKKSSQKSTM